MSLTQEQVSHFAALPLRGLTREYPNHIVHLMNSPEDAKTPKQLYPVFYGCFDWHSSVHGFWLLARSLNLYPNLPQREQIEELFTSHFTRESFKVEADYFKASGRNSFERPYGWAWLLALAQELKISSSPHATQWHENMLPLVEVIHHNFINFLPKQTYPIRTGTHSNTAFALVLAYDWAKDMGMETLITVIKKATQIYKLDKNYPAYLEPNGDDFLSSGLCEALLMSRVLPLHEFLEWFEAFLPQLQSLNNLLNPVQISDREDPKICHLEGLNLSRSWCMRGIAKKLAHNHKWKVLLEKSATLHSNTSLPHIANGNFLSGEHWLATFAMLAESVHKE